MPLEDKTYNPHMKKIDIIETEHGHVMEKYDDGSIECFDTEYYKRNIMVWHNTVGPALIWNDGEVNWFIEDIELSFDEWCKETNKTPEEIVMLKLKYPNAGNNYCLNLKDR